MTPPSEQQKDTGWTHTQDGVSDYDNWAKFWTYKWIEWLNDGDVAFDDISVDDLTAKSVTYNGTATVNLTADVAVLDPLSTGDTDSLHTILLDSNADDWTVRGLVAGVDGREVQIINTSARRIKVELTFASATTDFWAPSQHLTNNLILILNGQGSAMRLRWRTAVGWEILSTIGCLGHKKFVISGASVNWADGAGVTFNASLAHAQPTGTVGVVYPVTLPEHSIIDAFKIYVNKTGAEQISARMHSRAGNTATVGTHGLVTNASSNPGFISLPSPGGLGLRFDPVSTSTQYWVLAHADSGAGASNTWLHVDVFAWVPIS